MQLRAVFMSSILGKPAAFFADENGQLWITQENLKNILPGKNFSLAENFYCENSFDSNNQFVVNEHGLSLYAFLNSTSEAQASSFCQEFQAGIRKYRYFNRKYASPIHPSLRHQFAPAAGIDETDTCFMEAL